MIWPVGLYVLSLSFVSFFVISFFGIFVGLDVGDAVNANTRPTVGAFEAGNGPSFSCHQVMDIIRNYFGLY